MNIGRRLAALLLLPLLLLGCESALGPSSTGTLSVEVEAGSLVLTNRTDAPVYTFVIDGALAMRALWAPCTDPRRCTAIAPGARRTVPVEELAGYEAGREQTLLVYWWHLVPADRGAFRPDSLRVEPARLP